MKIVNIQKANEYYGNLNDVNAINALKMKIYSVASIGATLLLTGLNLNHAMNIGTGEFINNGLSVVLPLASAYTGIYLNSALHKAKELENTRKNKNEAINAIASGSLEEQRKFLQDRYPGLFDSITRPTEKKKIKIVNVEKLRDHYNEKSKENKSIVNKLLLSSVGSIGISLLLMKFNMMNAAAIGGAGFSQIGTACLLPLLSTLAGIKINSSVHGLVESENLTKEHNRVSYLIKYGSEEEKRTFLQKRYPGLYDSILENYENSKGKSR